MREGVTLCRNTFFIGERNWKWGKRIRILILGKKYEKNNISFTTIQKNLIVFYKNIAWDKFLKKDVQYEQREKIHDCWYRY